MNEELEIPIHQNPNHNDDFQLGPIELNILERVEKGLHISFDIDSISNQSKTPKYEGPKEIIFLNGWANLNTVYQNYNLNFIIKILLGISILISILYLECNFILIPMVLASYCLGLAIMNIYLLIKYRKSDKNLKFIFMVEINSNFGLFIYFLGFILGQLEMIIPHSLVLFSIPYLIVATLLFIYDENKHDFIYQKKFDILFAFQLSLISFKFTNPNSMRLNYVLFIFLFIAIYFFFLGFFLAIILSCSLMRIYRRNVEGWKIKALIWMTFYYLTSGLSFLLLIKSAIIYFNELDFFDNQFQDYFQYKSEGTYLLIKSGVLMVLFSMVNFIMHVVWKTEIKKYLAKIIYKNEIQKEISLRILTENFTFNIIQVSSTYFSKLNNNANAMKKDLENNSSFEKTVKKNNKQNEENKQNDNLEENCILCYENEPNILIDPCCHGGVCKGCIIAFLKSGGKNCPLCKGSIRKLFLLEIDKKNQKIFAKGEINLEGKQ